MVSQWMYRRRLLSVVTQTINLRCSTDRECILLVLAEDHRGSVRYYALRHRYMSMHRIRLLKKKFKVYPFYFGRQANH